MADKTFLPDDETIETARLHINRLNSGLPPIEDVVKRIESGSKSWGDAIDDTVRKHSAGYIVHVPVKQDGSWAGPYNPVKDHDR